MNHMAPAIRKFIACANKESDVELLFERPLHCRPAMHFHHSFTDGSQNLRMRNA